MIAATSTMWDVLHWGGETQALIYDPHAKKVIAINGLGMAPTGATPEFFKGKGFKYPPAYGPLAAVTPGTPGGIILMLQDYGTLSLAEVLAPAIELADGYPIDGVVLTTGCDKTTSAQLMAAATVDIPAITLNGGPMLDGWWQGKRAGSGTIVWESRRLLSEGKIDYPEFIERVCASAPSLGR